jgi:hypothetical protein
MIFRVWNVGGFGGTRQRRLRFPLSYLAAAAAGGHRGCADDAGSWRWFIVELLLYTHHRGECPVERGCLSGPADVLVDPLVSVCHVRTARKTREEPRNVKALDDVVMDFQVITWLVKAPKAACGLRWQCPACTIQTRQCPERSAQGA